MGPDLNPQVDAPDPSTATPTSTQPAPPTTAPQNMTQPSIQPVSDESQALFTPDPKVSTPAAKKHHYGRNMALILIAIVLLAVAAGYYYVENKYGGVKITSGTYMYSPLDAVQLPGDTKGHGAAFSKPVELTTPVKNSKANIDLAFSIPKDRTAKQQLSFISFVVGTTGPHTDNFYTKYAKILANTKDQDYKDASTPLTASTKSRLGDEYSVSFGNVQQFTSANIKQHAWKIDFTATKVKGNSDKPQKIKGSTVMAMGKDATYYLIISAEEKNWKVNQSTWDQVFNSLKIDLNQ